MSLKARGKCGLGHPRLATDGPGPGERQRRRGHELGLRLVGSLRVAMTGQKALFAAIAQNRGREGLHILTACTRLVHGGGVAGHITVGGADIDLRNALAIASDGLPGDHLEPSPWHHEPLCELEDPRQVRFGTARACY